MRKSRRPIFWSTLRHCVEFCS